MYKGPEVRMWMTFIPGTLSSSGWLESKIWQEENLRNKLGSHKSQGELWETFPEVGFASYGGRCLTDVQAVGWWPQLLHPKMCSAFVLTPCSPQAAAPSQWLSTAELLAPGHLSSTWASHNVQSWLWGSCMAWSGLAACLRTELPAACDPRQHCWTQ